MERLLLNKRRTWRTKRTKLDDGMRAARTSVLKRGCDEIAPSWTHMELLFFFPPHTLVSCTWTPTFYLASRLRFHGPRQLPTPTMFCGNWPTTKAPQANLSAGLIFFKAIMGRIHICRKTFFFIYSTYLFLEGKGISAGRELVRIVMTLLKKRPLIFTRCVTILRYIFSFLLYLLV